MRDIFMKKTKDVQKMLDTIEDRINGLESNARDSKVILKELILQVKIIADLLNGFEEIEPEFIIPYSKTESYVLDNANSLFDYLLTIESNIEKMKELEKELVDVKDMIIPNMIGES